MITQRFLWLLLLITLIKGLLWAGITPIFQAPDEPYHYAQTQNFSENNKYNLGKNVASQEIENALKYLEFEKIIFRPKSRQSFTNSIIGKNENKILLISDTQRKKQAERLILAVFNPPLYYSLATFFYNFSPQKNLLWRVYFLRLYSIICFVLTIYFCFLAIEIVFKNKQLKISIPVIISFLPMVSFITSSINNDNLFLLLVTIVFYFIIKDAKTGLKFFETLWLGVISGLAFLTKQDFFPLFFGIFICLLLNRIINRKLRTLDFLLYTFCFIIISGFWYLKQPVFRDFFLKLPKNVILGRSHYEDLNKKDGNYNCLAENSGINARDEGKQLHTSPANSGVNLEEPSFPQDACKLGKKTPAFQAREVYKIKPYSYLFYISRFIRHNQPKKIFNYFWGTFGWVDTRLPRIVYWTIFIICLASFIGFLRYLSFLRNFRKIKQNFWLFELLFLSLLFFFSLSYYEWRFYQVYEDFFLQGRYFFPIILPLIIFLTIGWQNLFPRRWQVKALFFLVILMIFFNSYCLFFIMIPRYYNTGNLITLVKEVSQYKPIFLKGIAWPILIFIYFILVIKLIYQTKNLLWKKEEK